jgi:hypothetical protein
MELLSRRVTNDADALRVVFVRHGRAELLGRRALKRDRGLSVLTQIPGVGTSIALLVSAYPSPPRDQPGRLHPRRPPAGAAVEDQRPLELCADELFLALVELDLGLRLRCLVCRGDKPDPLGLELGLAPLALPLLSLILRPAHAVPPFASPSTR